MNTHLIDTRALRYITALAKHNNFHRAAESLFITQPALTKSIKTLEHALGLTLFDRLSNKVTPTPYCDIILEHANTIFLELESINNKLEDITGLKKGTLRMGCGPQMADMVLSDSFIKLINGHSQNRIHFVIENWSILTQMLRDGEIHLFIADIEEIEGQPDLAIFHLPKADSTFFCRPNHPLARDGTVNPKDLLKYKMAAPSMPERGIKWLRNNAPKGVSENDFCQQVLSFSCDNQTIIKKVVQHSDYLTGGSDNLFSEEVKSGLLIKLKSKGFSHMTHLAPGIVTLKNRTLPPLAERMIECLKSTYNQHQ